MTLNQNYPGTGLFLLVHLNVKQPPNWIAMFHVCSLYGMLIHSCYIPKEGAVRVPGQNMDTTVYNAISKYACIMNRIQMCLLQIDGKRGFIQERW